MKIVCPNCKKEIEEQAEIEFPRSSGHGVKKIIGPEVVYGNLVLRNGTYFLVLEVVVKCPYCQESFCSDVWLSVFEQLG